MNKVILAVVLAMFASAVMALPPGKPFVEIDGDIVAVQSELEALQDQIDLLVVDVTSLEDQVTALQNGLADLQVDVVANADAIALIEIRLAQAEADLLLKQNIVSGTCPDGQAMVSVNVGVNDGYIVCADTGASIDLAYVSAYSFSPPSGSPYATANCPAGYQVTGGGVSWVGGVASFSPVGGGTGFTGRGLAGSGAGFALMIVNAICIK